MLVTAKPSPTLFSLNTVFHGHISLKSVLLLPSAGIAGVRYHTPDSVYVCRLAHVSENSLSSRSGQDRGEGKRSVHSCAR